MPQPSPPPPQPPPLADLNGAVAVNAAPVSVSVGGIFIAVDNDTSPAYLRGDGTGASASEQFTIYFSNGFLVTGLVGSGQSIIVRSVRTGM